MKRITQGVLLIRIAVLKLRLTLLRKRYESSIKWYRELRKEQQRDRGNIEIKMDPGKQPPPEEFPEITFC